MVLPHFVGGRQAAADPPAAAPTTTTTTTTDPATAAPTSPPTTATTTTADQPTPTGSLDDAIARYQEKVISRTRPAVLASRQAALDAHRWERISEKSPLLSRRVIDVVFGEGDLDESGFDEVET